MVVQHFHMVYGIGSNPIITSKQIFISRYMNNFIWTLIGIVICILLGMIIGFWIEELTYSPLTNGFYECKGCL